MQSRYKNGIVIGLLSVVLCACATVPESTNDNASTQISEDATPVVVSNETTLVAETDAIDPNKRICKNRRQENSRFMRKICLTQAEWDKAAQQARSGTAYLQQRSFSTGP